MLGQYTCWGEVESHTHDFQPGDQNLCQVSPPCNELEHQISLLICSKILQHYNIITHALACNLNVAEQKKGTLYI